MQYSLFCLFSLSINLFYHRQLSALIVVHPSCKIATDGAGCIKNGSKQILLNVADFGCVFTDVLNMFTVNF